MRTVQKFITSDDKEFTDKDEARRHQARLDATEKLESLLEASMRIGRPSAVIQHMLSDAESVGKILATYRRQTFVKEEIPAVAKAA